MRYPAVSSGTKDPCGTMARGGKRTMSIVEIEDYLRRRITAGRIISLTSHNERFRRILYDSYLGAWTLKNSPSLQAGHPISE